MAVNLKRDFSAPILDLDGNPVRAGASTDAVLRAVERVVREADPALREKFNKALKEEAEAPLTLGHAASAALIAPHRDEQPSDEERVARLGLAMMVHNGGMVEISPDQRDRIKKVVGKHYLGSLVAPRCWDLLERDPVEQAPLPGKAAQPAEGS